METSTSESTLHEEKLTDRITHLPTIKQQKEVATPNGSHHTSPSGSCELPRLRSFLRRIIETLDTHLVENFTPAFFTTVMGTGISCNILSNFPYPGHWMVVCSYIMFGFCCVAFAVCTVLFVLCCLRHHERWYIYNLDIRQSVFMGCIAMGFTTIVNYIYFLVKDYRHGPIGAYVLWWVAVVLLMYTAFITFYFLYVAKFERSKHAPRLELRDLNITLLMPVVSLCVTSSLGNIIVPGLPTTHLKVLTLVCTFAMWAIAVTLAFMITTIYFQRLFIYKIPSTNMVFLMFLPIGFLGQALYAILSFAANCFELIRAEGLQPHWARFFPTEAADDRAALAVGALVMVVCGFAGLLLICFGYFMTFLAVVSTLSKLKPFARTPNEAHTKHGVVKFFKGFWSMTFPMGTMSLGNHQFFVNFGDGFVFFRAMGAVYATATVGITVGCLVGFAYKAVKAMKEKKEEREEDKKEEREERKKEEIEERNNQREEV